MTIDVQYYVWCNGCCKAYESRTDDAQGLEDEAVDDGWTVVGRPETDQNNIPTNRHLCAECSRKGYQL